MVSGPSGVKGFVMRMAKAVADVAGVSGFRVEVNQQYTTRYQELLMLHVHDHGDVPAGNQGKPLPRLGRLSPL